METASGKLSKWRVSLVAQVELAALSQEEALYSAVRVVQRNSREMLQPLKVERLEELAILLEEKRDRYEPDPRGQQDGERAPKFEEDPAVKAKWVKELVAKVAEEVATKLSVVEKPRPIPLEEE